MPIFCKNLYILQQVKLLQAVLALLEDTIVRNQAVFKKYIWVKKAPAFSLQVPDQFIAV
jgi:hypothetical protein